MRHTSCKPQFATAFAKEHNAYFITALHQSNECDSITQIKAGVICL